jgi:TrmH family RNA methyltransferase
MSDDDLITSAANPLVRRIRALTGAQGRREAGVLFCEGPQPVWRAVEARADIEMLVVAPELLAGSPSENLVEEQRARGMRVVRVSTPVFQRISDRNGPAGIGAVVRRRQIGLDALQVESDSVFVVLHEIGNPGNLGSIVRTADAAGATAVVLTGVTADPNSPQAVKASMGSLFSMPIARELDVDRMFDWAKSNGLALVTTSARAASSSLDFTFERPLALMFGSEGEGLGGDLLRRGDIDLRIPMVGTASSLNLSVAVGVLLFQVQAEMLAAAPRP